MLSPSELQLARQAGITEREAERLLDEAKRRLAESFRPQPERSAYRRTATVSSERD